MIRVGTRGSALARVQSETVARAIRQRTGRPVGLVEIVTAGDRSARPIEAIGTVGVFTSALRDALLDRRVDVAVHSFKDLPTATPLGLHIAAVPERVDPRDVLVTRDGAGLDELPAGARVATGAPRRIAQLTAAYPRLQLVPIRGNVGTRISAVLEGRIDAVVLAAAGLLRLGLLEVGSLPPAGAGTPAGSIRLAGAAAYAMPIDTDLVLPAPAQGALAVECRESADPDDIELADALGRLDHTLSRATVVAERAQLAALEAGCTAPVGALAKVMNGTLVLTGVLASADGSSVVRRTSAGPEHDAVGIGQRVAADLLSAGVPDPLGSTR